MHRLLNYWAGLVTLVLALAFGMAMPAPADVPVPLLKARVTDLTNTLTADQRAALEQKLAAFEARKGSQIAVLLVPTTEFEAIEQYSIRVAEQWKLGRKGVDDGILLLIAKNDRKLRLEVGRGLEGAIPDAIAKRIVSDVITPRFKEGDFHGGIIAGVDRILRTIEGEPLPPPQPAVALRHTDDWVTPVVVVVFLAIVLGGLLRGIFGRLLGAGIAGFAAGVLGYIVLGIVAAAIFALITFLINIFGMSTAARGIGGVDGAGSSWDSSGGFSSGGGDFGGGGGDFGGGGASGSW